MLASRENGSARRLPNDGREARHRGCSSLKLWTTALVKQPCDLRGTQCWSVRREPAFECLSKLQRVRVSRVGFGRHRTQQDVLELAWIARHDIVRRDEVAHDDGGHQLRIMVPLERAKTGRD